ncbi:MAG TPA: proton-conducting transporter membrane subunit [Polyangiaceae bacterium]
MNEALILVGIVLVGTSGLPGAFLSRQSAVGERVAAVLMVVGSTCGIAGAGAVALAARLTDFSLPWAVPGGELAVRIDGIAAMFLLQIFLIAPLGSIYGLRYWKQSEHPDNGRKLRLFFGVLTAALALLVIAHNSLLFLLGWETMALAAFVLITTEDTDEEVHAAGFVYIVATRVGTLCLFAMFALLHVAAGSWTFAAPSAMAPSLANTIFVLAVVGFGLKAGMMPMHVWLPGAHANAPSHVSALMSGVLIKSGIYGLVRVCSFFEHPPLWWGVTLLVLGIVSGVLGVAFAIGQHDMKRLLAYHSVENIGIITIGIAIAVIGRSLEQPELVVLGITGALLHVWNHGLFKALLFLSAGAVLHATGTREIDQLGGLAKKMPWTALAFVIGAVAICGLPPLNGFVSELLVYLALFRSMLLASPGAWIAGAFGAPALALIGGLALACFAKVFSTVFLGSARSDRVDHAHEAGALMIAPMAILAACCAFIGLVPSAIAPILDHAARIWAPETSHGVPLGSLAPLSLLSVTGFALVTLLALGGVLIARLTGPSRVRRSVTWDCGYAAPSSHMQYTASSFADSLVRLFSWALRPEQRSPSLASPFPRTASFSSHVPDTFLDRAILPTLRGIGRGFVWFRWAQRGNVHVYLLYILATLLLTLLVRR